MLRFTAAAVAVSVWVGVGLAGCDDGAVTETPRCRPGQGASGSPTSIAEAAALVNSLPRPVTIECFLESLDRPLRLSATSSIISLQPAAGGRSPRVFLLTDHMVMSIVIDGNGRNFAEFGEFVTPTRTLKGEIAFPVEERLAHSEPYQRIRSDGPVAGSRGSSCRFCHSSEEEFPQSGGATGWVSEALKPDARSLISIGRVRQERDTCDDATEPSRCRMLRALFDHGNVVETAFPDQIPTIFRN